MTVALSLREFSVGDQVVALCPLVSSPFQAKYSGPYTVVERVSDQNYLIATPGRRKPVKLYHVHLLKPLCFFFQYWVTEFCQSCVVNWVHVYFRCG